MPAKAPGSLHTDLMASGRIRDPFVADNEKRVLGNALKLLDPSLSRQEQLRRIVTCLTEVGLDPADVLNKWPRQLSGGRVQRVMIARALVTGPELLIADEPTSMLDASLRVTVLNLLLDLRKRHIMGIIFITHDVGQAYYLSDRNLVMYNGALVEQGSVEKVLADPNHDYTKGLLADVPRLHRKDDILAWANARSR